MAFTAEGGVEPKGERYDRSYLVKSDDKLYKRTEFNDFIYSSNNLDVGSIGLNKYGTAVISDVYEIFRVKPNSSPTFMSELIQRPHNIAEILKYRQGCLYGQYRIYAEDFLNVSVLVPTKTEQEKVSQFFDALDHRIEHQAGLIKALKKYKRGVMSVLLSSKDNPYYSSETWEEVSLCDVASGFEYGMNAAATIYDGSHRYIRITDIDDSSHLYIQDELVSPEGQVEEKYRVRENDILFARTGASVGKSYCYQRSDGNLYFAGFLIRIHINSDVDCSYVFQNTLTEAYRRWVMLESARSGQPGINAEQYKQYRFLLPPIETQKKISFLASNLDTLISKGESLLSQLEQTKAALLQQLFI